MEPVHSTVGQAAHEVAQHVQHASQSEQPVKELANFITLLVQKLHGTPVGNFLHHWENFLFSMIAALSLVLICFIATRKKSLIPSGLQNLVEMVVEGMESMVVGVMGDRGRTYIPFIGTLFIYIFIQNWMGLVPGLKSPTSSINTTAGLAVSVFFYVQWIGIKENGFGGYLFHLMGSPKDVTGWAMVPMNLPLHILEEFIRPLSLALRLFGNVLGEDALIGVFAGLGILTLSFIHSPIGVPLQLPFMMLAMLTGTIQALVFTLLSTIYITLMLPHEEHEH